MLIQNCVPYEKIQLWKNTPVQRTCALDTHQQYSSTLDREILMGDIFSWVARPTIIKHTKIYLRQIIIRATRNSHMAWTAKIKHNKNLAQNIFRARSFSYTVVLYLKQYLWLVVYGEQSIDCSPLPRFCSHELLQPSATKQEKLTDVKIHLRIMFGLWVIKNFNESQVNTHVV